MHQKKLKKLYSKYKIKISRELRDIIHGYIMSDGYVNSYGTLAVEQSKQQEKFVEWLYQKMTLLRTDTPISSKEPTRLDKRTNTKTYSRRFVTRNLLKGFRAMWYKPYTTSEGVVKYRKCLPKSLHCFFNTTFITLWFAGDGTKMIDQRGAKFEVTSLTPEERKRLQALFQEKFNISVKINRAGESTTGTPQWTLSINAPEYDKFRALITQMDLIQNLFPYKLHPMRP